MGGKIIITESRRVPTGESKREGFFTLPVVEVRATQVIWRPNGGCSEPVWETSCESAPPEATQ